ncbi:uncharacterized protein LOC143646407 isoform X2 [Tamandua tetradactyla]|uniref:uncharacterized protein LOC143646407 isoform X2 n=1 Tax=Tamandua tetradactyla TaxID=48850 RepID=UPI004053C3BE
MQLRHQAPLHKGSTRGKGNRLSQAWGSHIRRPEVRTQRESPGGQSGGQRPRSCGGRGPGWRIPPLPGVPRVEALLFSLLRCPKALAPPGLPPTPLPRASGRLGCAPTGMATALCCSPRAAASAPAILPDSVMLTGLALAAKQQGSDGAASGQSRRERASPSPPPAPAAAILEAGVRSLVRPGPRGCSTQAPPPLRPLESQPEHETSPPCRPLRSGLVVSTAPASSSRPHRRSLGLSWLGNTNGPMPKKSLNRHPVNHRILENRGKLNSRISLSRHSIPQSGPGGPAETPPTTAPGRECLLKLKWEAAGRGVPHAGQDRKSRV